MKYKMMFFAPEGGDGGGVVSEPASSSKGMEIFSPAKQTTGDRPLPTEKLDSTIARQDPQQPAGSEPAGDGSGAPGTSTPIPFDPSKFAKDLGKSVAEAVRPTEKRSELSPEEAKKLLNVWEPDDAWYAEYDNLETRKSAVAKMRDGLIRQSDTIAQLRMHELIDQLRGELNPQLSTVQEFVHAQREDRFHKTYPQLARPELKPLVMAVASDLMSKGQKFDSEADMFKALGSGVESMIKVTNPEFKLEGADKTPASQPGRTNNSIPSTSPGSGGGVGRGIGSPTSQPKSRGLAVFDK